MTNKIVLSVLGFGLGIFMLFNSSVVLYQLLTGQAWDITPTERAFSVGITCLVGVVLITWTYLLVKKS